MEWWWLFIIIVGSILLILATGMPVAFAFIIVNLVGVLILQGGGRAYQSLILSMYSSVSTFTILPVPLFILMGEILWHSRVAFRAIDVLDKLLGRLPGRLSILTVLSGTVFSSLSGSTMATTAVLGTMLLPDMERRGYKRGDVDRADPRQRRFGHDRAAERRSRSSSPPSANCPSGDFSWRR